MGNAVHDSKDGCTCLTDSDDDSTSESSDDSAHFNRRLFLCPIDPNVLVDIDMDGYEPGGFEAGLGSAALREGGRGWLGGGGGGTGQCEARRGCVYSACTLRFSRRAHASPGSLNEEALKKLHRRTGLSANSFDPTENFVELLFLLCGCDYGAFIGRLCDHNW